MKFNIKYKKYLLEVENDISKITDKIKKLEINLEPYKDLHRININGIIKMEYEVMNDQVYIEHIEVNKNYRKLGLSKLLLTKFLNETDKRGLPVTLMVYPTDDVTEDQLVNIYKKFGFNVVGKDKGNNRPLMKREVIKEDQWEKYRKDFPNIDDFLATLGLGPKYVPKEVKKYTCPKCLKNEAYYKEIHPDTSMNDVVLFCPECKFRGKE